MDIKKQIDILTKGRVLMLKLIEGVSLEQLNVVPTGFNNSIGWNVAHLVVTQQLLCYKLSGLEALVSDEMIGKYRKGTKPTAVIDKKEWEAIVALFLDLPKRLETDYEAGIFKEYHSYETSVSILLDSLEKAIDFNNFHEGIHLGVIMALKKLV